MLKFQIHRGRWTGRYWYTVEGRNGKVLATSKKAKFYADLMTSILEIKISAPMAKVFDYEGKEIKEV